ncbi:hypothetical protein SDC9_166428 [bioreactor metagenome]|uniref:Uncharacterized protein n=1 Tax=bioreactor metagenome TaxID=1076179 RepID=A0A645FZE1_9ZZZZ
MPGHYHLGSVIVINHCHSIRLCVEGYRTVALDQGDTQIFLLITDRIYEFSVELLIVFHAFGKDDGFGFQLIFDLAGKKIVKSV